MHGWDLWLELGVYIASLDDNQNLWIWISTIITRRYVWMRYEPVTT
jgi:hypothetical protein